jgi:phosphoribosylformimino-5-aminoimidazole carboxamide ribotide isomerase
MKLIPVIDLLNGQVVHAVRGQRQHYQPVKSVLCNTSDPLAIAKAFRDRMGLNEFYIADLDAIQRHSQSRHRKIIEALIRIDGIRIILDAGVSDIKSIRELFDMGVRKAVVGSETLCMLSSLEEIPKEAVSERLVFSLDLRAGKILSRCAALSEMPSMKALEHLQSAGWQEVLLLDLMRVGSGEGVDRTLMSEARARFPRLHLLVGGGISKAGDLIELESLGVAGVLAATAFHNGAIMAQHICNWSTMK